MLEPLFCDVSRTISAKRLENKPAVLFQPSRIVTSFKDITRIVQLRSFLPVCSCRESHAHFLQSLFRRIVRNFLSVNSGRRFRFGG
jgi:hypothetical protein